MKLVRLIDAPESGTQLGAVLGAMMRNFPMYKLVYNLSRSDMQSNFGKFKRTARFNTKNGNWTPKVKNEVLTQLKKVQDVCERSGFATAEAIEDLSRRIAEDDPHTLDNLGTHIAAVRNEICRNFNRLAYVEIPQCQRSLFDPPRPLFGKEVADNFRSSAKDITEAGKCLALDRSTAAVMHLMRALETPLFLMARKVRINTKRRSEWGRIIEKIERKLAPPTGEKSPVRKDLKEFLLIAAGQFRVFKEAWRNHAMHARSTYDQEMAAAIFTAVESFMKHLATRLKEPKNEKEKRAIYPADAVR